MNGSEVFFVKNKATITRIAPQMVVKDVVKPLNTTATFSGLRSKVTGWIRLFM